MRLFINPHIFLLATLFTSSVFAASPGTELIGKMRPGFSLPSLEGGESSIDQWNGKVVVLNFWASWCGPCQKEMPMLNRVQKEYATEGVQLVGLAVDSLPNVQTFIKKIPIAFPVLIGNEAAFNIVAQYGNRDGVLPYTVFIDRTGKIAAIAKGALTETYTRNTIEKLL